MLEKSRFSSKPLDNIDLSPLIEHQKKIIAIDKLGNKKEPLRNLSLEELNLILTIRDMKDKYGSIISPLINKLENNGLSKTTTSANCCRKMGFFALGAVSGVVLACSVAYRTYGYK